MNRGHPFGNPQILKVSKFSDWKDFFQLAIFDKVDTLMMIKFCILAQFTIRSYIVAAHLWALCIRAYYQREYWPSFCFRISFIKDLSSDHHQWPHCSTSPWHNAPQSHFIRITRSWWRGEKTIQKMRRWVPIGYKKPIFQAKFDTLITIIMGYLAN